MMTALRAKVLSLPSEEILVFSTFLAHNYPRFIQSYREWDDETRLFSEFSYSKL